MSMFSAYRLHGSTRGRYCYTSQSAYHNTAAARRPLRLTLPADSASRAASKVATAVRSQLIADSLHSLLLARSTQHNSSWDPPKNKYSVVLLVSVLSLFLMLWIHSWNRLFARLGAPRRFHNSTVKDNLEVDFNTIFLFYNPTTVFPAWLSHSRVPDRTDRFFMDTFHNSEYQRRQSASVILKTDFL